VFERIKPVLIKVSKLTKSKSNSRQEIFKVLLIGHYMKYKNNQEEISVRDTLDMKYDYSAGWGFSIELIAVSEIKRGAGTHYPYVTNGIGKGKRNIEVISPYELKEIIEQIDEIGSIPQVYDSIIGEEKAWDYRNFDLKFLNVFFKDIILQIQQVYEAYE